MNAMYKEKAWSFFSFGLFFAITGSLVLLYLMMQFEQGFSSENESDEPFLTPYAEDEKEALNGIVLNLNEELDTKRKEIQYLSSENFNLKHRLEEVEIKLKAKIEEIPQIIENRHQEEIAEDMPEFEEEKAEEIFEEVLTPTKITENLYRQDNRIEVTRL